MSVNELVRKAVLDSYMKKEKKALNILGVHPELQPENGLTSNCWITDRGEIYRCNYGNHYLLLDILYKAGIAPTPREYEVELKGWVKCSGSMIQLAYLPVKQSVFDVLLYDFTCVSKFTSYMYDGESRIFQNQEDLEAYLLCGGW